MNKKINKQEHKRSQLKLSSSSELALYKIAFVFRCRGNVLALSVRQIIFPSTIHTFSSQVNHFSFLFLVITNKIFSSITLTVSLSLYKCSFIRSLGCVPFFRSMRKNKDIQKRKRKRKNKTVYLNFPFP